MNKKISYDNIYNKYYHRIFNYLSRSVGSEDAEDLTQEVFLSVLKTINKFKNQSSVYTWIYRIATNKVIDYYRKKKIDANKCNLSDKELFCKIDPDYLTEEFKIVKNEMDECICSYIKMLNTNYRTVIILKEYENMSIKEISEIMNINYENAKKMLFRAKKKLKSILEERCNFYYNEFNQLSCEKK